MRLFPSKMILFLGFLGYLGQAQGLAQDVPEAVFPHFSVQPPYVPVYHGRDPFKPLDNIDRLPQISIAELDYHGVVSLNEQPMALFTWRGNPSVRYTLKFRKLYSGNEKLIDGVVGTITDSQVTLTQGDQKIVYLRK